MLTTWTKLSAKHTEELLESYSGHFSHDQALATQRMELARSLHKPTQTGWKKAKRRLRYLRGTSNYEFCVQPTAQLNDEQKLLDLDVYGDAGLAVQ